MKPIPFKECNIKIAEDQDQYGTLPAFIDRQSPRGEVVTCWNLSFRERLRVLFTGRIWMCLLSFNNPLTPSYLTTSKGELLQQVEVDTENI